MSDDARKTCRFQQKPKRIANRVVIVDNENSRNLRHSADSGSEILRSLICKARTRQVSRWTLSHSDFCVAARLKLLLTADNISALSLAMKSQLA